MTQFQPRGYSLLPPVVKNLIIINVIIFIIQEISKYIFHYPLANLFALHYWQSSMFHPYQLITCMFMHATIMHILLNMFALWMFGYIVENILGPKRFLAFYLICGIGASICFLGAQTIEFHNLVGSSLYGSATNLNPLRIQYSNMPIAQFLYEPVLGASGAIFGVLVAFGTMFPNRLIYLYFFVPIKAKWFVIGYIALQLYMGIRRSPGDHVAHFAHLGGALFGFILIKIWQKRGIGRGGY